MQRRGNIEFFPRQWKAVTLATTPPPPPPPPFRVLNSRVPLESSNPSPLLAARRERERVTVGSYANLLRLNYAYYMRFQIAGNANRNPIYFSTDKKKPSASESEGAGALFSPSIPSSFRTSLLLREREMVFVFICSYLHALCREVVPRAGLQVFTRWSTDLWYPKPDSPFLAAASIDHPRCSNHVEP